MSKYKILWVIPLFFIISICGVLYFQKNISNDMSRSEIAYINNHLIIPLFLSCGGPTRTNVRRGGYEPNELSRKYCLFLCKKRTVKLSQSFSLMLRRPDSNETSVAADMSPTSSHENDCLFLCKKRTVKPSQSFS
jgi:hypothetical protein